jgi:hypothetical protein
MLIAATIAGSSAACLGRVRVYDTPRQDYHRWDRAEERSYRAYLAERRQAYVEFQRLSRREQDEYWEWRHSRGDRDRDDRDRDRDRR